MKLGLAGRTFNQLDSAIMLSVAMFFAGCGSGGVAPNSFPSSPSSPPIVADQNVSGNWQGALSTTKGIALGTIAGAIDQSGGMTSSGQFTTATLRISSPCFSDSPHIPAQGFTDKGKLTLNSFTVNSQNVALMGSLQSDGSRINGTYTVFWWVC